MRGWKTYTSVKEFARSVDRGYRGSGFAALPDKCPGAGEPAIRACPTCSWPGHYGEGNRDRKPA